MSFFLYLFYESAKALVRVVRRVYYGRLEVVHAERGRMKEPCILVSNHPGTLMDPLNAAVLMRRHVHFLANASLFVTRFSHWFFSTFYCIKVERYQDTGGRPVQNERAFETAIRFLSGGGCLYVAPEGTSLRGRRLHPLKTGAARIALNAEEANDFRLGLVILPVGLNYSDPGAFRGSLLSIMGAPVRVADFKKDWEADKVGAVKKLTTRLWQRMEEILIHTTDEEEDRLLARVEELLENDRPLGLYPHFLRTKGVLKKIQGWRAGQPQTYSAFRAVVDSYFKKIKKWRTSDRAWMAVQKAEFRRRWVVFALGSVVVFPFFLVGFCCHLLPVAVTGAVSRRMYDDPAWAPTFKVLSGIVFYILFLVLQTGLIYFFCKNTIVALAFLLSFFPLGLVAERYARQWKLLWQARRIVRKAQHEPEAAKELAGLRRSILGYLS